VPAFGDVGADADDATFCRAAVGDAQPAAVGQLQFEAAFATAMALDPLLDPGLGIGRRLRVLAARDSAAHDHLEAAARGHEIAAHGEEFAIPTVAGDQALVGIPQDEAVADALERVGESRLSALQLVLDVAPLGDVEDDAVAIDRLARLVEDPLPALEHAAHAAVPMRHTVLDLIGPLVLEAVGHDAGDVVDILRMDQAAVGADRIVDEVVGGETRKLHDGVADELHGVVGVVGAAVGHARDIADQGPELGLADPQRRRPLGDGGLEALVGLSQVVLPRSHRLQIAAPMFVRLARQPDEPSAHDQRTRSQEQHDRSEGVLWVDDAGDGAQVRRRHDRQYADRDDDVEGEIELPTPWRP
jgi:hypothetical protein